MNRTIRTRLSTGVIRLRHGEGGFSLVESLVAVAILGVIGVVYIGAVDTNNRATAQLDEHTAAKNLIVTTIESIRQADYANDYDAIVAAIPTPNRYAIMATTDCTDDPTDDLSYGDCTGTESWQRIYVSVAADGQPTLRICTYRAKR